MRTSSKTWLGARVVAAEMEARGLGSGGGK